MAYFFQQKLISKVMMNIKETIEDKELNSPAYLISNVFKNLDLEEIKIEGKYLVFCPDCIVTSHDFYSKGECDEAVNALKEEIKKLFYRDSEVSFVFFDMREQEPEPIPPLYWGGTETIYYYKLSTKMKIKFDI